MVIELSKWWRHAGGVTAELESDVDLLKRVARGNEQALGELYDRYQRPMLAIGIRILRDRREAEDTLHDVFVEVWRKAGDYDPRRGKVRTWMFMRMRSRALDQVRSARLSRRVNLPEGEEENRGSVEVDEALSGDRTKLQGALHELSEGQREVLSLGYFGGLSSREIAGKLEIPIGTVKSRTASALAQLRLILQDKKVLI